LGSEKVQKIITNSSELDSLFRELSDATCVVLIEHLGPEKLRQITQNGHQLSQLLFKRYPHDETRTVLIANLGPDKLKEIIKNSPELHSVLHSLNETQGRAVITALGSDKLKQIINNADDLRFILFALNPENRLALMRDLGRNHLTSLLRQCRNGELSAYRGVFIQVYLSLRTADVRAVFVPGLWRCFQPHREQKMRLTQSLLGNPTQRAHNGLLGLIDRKTRPPSRR
jgi:Mg/Co/Ni transporter MgtE